MSTPIRIQRKRTKGFKLPENTICVTRGTKFGNPFQIGGWFKVGKNNYGYGMAWSRQLQGPGVNGYVYIKDNEDAVNMYKKYIEEWPLKKELLDQLKGHNLACFCPLDKPCHADILLEIANR